MIFRECISAPGQRFGSPSWSAYGVPSEPALKVVLNQCSAGQTGAGAAGSRAACADFTRHGASSTQAELDHVVAQRVAGHAELLGSRGEVAVMAPPHRFQKAGLEGGGRVRSEEHTSELQSLMRSSYA